jgi:HEAT repeat protein
MSTTALLVITLLFLAVIAGMAGILFWKGWTLGRREARIGERLLKQAGLIETLRTGGEDEFRTAVETLRSGVPRDLREAVLDASRDAAGDPVPVRLARSYDSLGITDRYIDELRNSPSWERRAMAAERLGKIGSARAVFPLLLTLRDVKDEDADVRGAALRALGRIRDPAAIPELIEALGTPEASLPQRIAEILVRFDAAAVGPLCRELRNRESEVRRMWAAEILGWLGNAEAGIPLIDALGDVNPEVRAKSAGALGKLSESRAIDRLLEMLLSDPIPFVRTRVAQALGAIGNPRVIDHLVQVLKDPEWWVRIRAIEALEQIGRESAGTLLAALEDEDGEVRRRAATALERMGYVRDSVETLEREGFRADLFRILLLIGRAGVTEGILGRITTARPPANKLLVRLAGEVGNPAAVPVLLEALQASDDASFRSRLVEALGKLGDTSAVPAILRCLKDSDSWVRRASVEALSAIGPREHTEELLDLLRDPAPETRVAVCRVATSLDPVVVGADVERLLADPAPEVRAEALRVVSILSLQGSEERVASLVEDPFPDVRVAAARALASVGSAGSVMLLLRAGKRADDRFREAVAAGLCHCHEGRFEELPAMAGKEATRDQTAILLEVAGRHRGEGRLEFVERHLSSTDPFLRKTAVQALAGFRYEDVRTAVTRALSDPDETVRDAAVQVAGFDGGVESVREVARNARDPHETVRFHVALALGLSERPEVRETLRVLAGDPSARVRAASVIALSLVADPAVREDFVRHAADAELCAVARKTFLPGSSDPLVSRVAEKARSGGALESRLFLGGSLFAVEKEMCQRARESLMEAERLQALSICEVVATGQSYTTALSILRNDPSAEVRVRAIDLLLKARSDAEAGRVMATMLVDPHPKVRNKAARTLGRMNYPDAVEALLRALDTTDREFREELTTALSAHLLRDPEHGEKILGGIPPGKTRKLGIIWLLGKTRRKGMMRELFRYLDDEDGDVRAAAVGALAKYRVGLIANHLRKSLTDPNPRVRAAAVNALSRVQTVENESEIAEMLADPDVYVRQRAALALLRMGSETAAARIRESAEEPTELQPIWMAGGVLLGIISPPEAAVNPDTARFLGELFPESEAAAIVGESADPGQRKRAFRALQVLSTERARRAALSLSSDPDPALREEARDWLERRAH